MNKEGREEDGRGTDTERWGRRKGRINRGRTGRRKNRGIEEERKEERIEGKKKLVEGEWHRGRKECRKREMKEQRSKEWKTFFELA